MRVSLLSYDVTVGDTAIVSVSNSSFVVLVTDPIVPVDGSKLIVIEGYVTARTSQINNGSLFLLRGNGLAGLQLAGTASYGGQTASGVWAGFSGKWHDQPWSTSSFQYTLAYNAFQGTLATYMLIVTMF